VTPSEARKPEPWFATILRMLVHAITGLVIAFPLTVVEGMAAASIGAAAGALGARFLAKSGVRSPAVALMGVVSMSVVLVAHFAVVDLSLFPSMLGPSSALKAGDAVLFGAGAFVVSIVLRSLSVRRPSFTILEAALIAGGFATLLVAHRNGAIHRPYEIADPLIAAGEDPTIAILAVGALGAAVIGLLLLSERSLLRSAFHLIVVFGLLFVILLTTTMAGLPTPPSGGGALGLRDDDRDPNDRQGGQGQRESDELDFLNEYPSGGTSPDAVVIFHDDYSPPGGYYYFRQSAFSQFNGRKLVASLSNDYDADVRNVFPSGRSRDVAWVPPTGIDRTAVETTVAMIADNSAPIGLEAPVRFQPATNPHPQRFRRIYRVHSVSTTSEPMALVGRHGGDPAWSEEIREHYLSYPESDPRYRALAERIVAELPEHLRADPWARALAITQYLGEHGTYSLRSRHAGADDPTAHFLFGDLVGYCVHFAHAAVYLMRAAGVPARVATGYAVPEANRQGGSALLLRNADQHAWPEVYLGAGPPRESLELTAMRRFRDARANGTADQLEYPNRVLAIALAYTEVLENFADVEPFDEFNPDGSTAATTEAELTTIAALVEMSVDELIAFTIERLEEELGPPSDTAGWIVADVAPENVLDPPGEPPDPQLQQLLAEMARGSTPVDDVQPPRPMAEHVRQLFGSWSPRELALLFTILILLPLFSLYSVKIWRRTAPLFSKQPRLVYRAVLDELSESGMSRRWGESPEAFALRVRASVPSLRRLVDRQLASAFGVRNDAAFPGRDAMVMDARRVGRELARAVPAWRRALGWINPFSWISTR
jgi:transglutaminase-like putative cysteine protease